MRLYKYNINEFTEQIEGKMEYQYDVAVLLIFFNRPAKISQVFNAVKQARPSRLYLYQDGARKDHPDDMENVISCREIVEDIDWNCTLHKLYQENNYGCDPSEFIAQKWMFATEEKGIVLEDDDVPSQSFFPYCCELLDKYEKNDSIAIICGMNNYDIEESIDESYFFSKRGSIWGWASWRRFIDLWDPEYLWLEDENKKQIIKQYCGNVIDYEGYKKTAVEHRNSCRAHYESIMFAAAALNNMLNIVPKYNMISNIGIDNETTHSVSDIRLLCKRTQKLLYKKTFEIELPLKHPIALTQNVAYDRKYSISFYQKLWDKFEVMIRRLMFK